MKKRRVSLVILAFLLIVSVSNFLRITNSDIRTVEFLSILAIGMILGLIIYNVFALIRNKE
jgi:hypothetical protein